jgi:hypothetical protein
MSRHPDRPSGDSVARAKPKPPRVSSSSSETDNDAELRVEELEERIAPRLATNHNHTFLVDR